MSLIRLSVLAGLMIGNCQPFPDKPPLEMPTPVTQLTPRQLLGGKIFFDTNLSEPRGQSCAVCHGPEVGWTGPDELLNKLGSIYEGAVPGRFGNRKALSSAYATPSPIFHLVDAQQGTFERGICLPENPGTPGVDCWPPPEVGLNVNTQELGNLGLTPEEEDALVAFLGTLSDGYFPP
jgi:di-heme cytochrome c peroxidase